MPIMELRPNCECCDRDLAPQSRDVFICTFECTFCHDCTDGVLKGICPNCSGELVRRPVRTDAMLAKYPASTIRKVKKGGCAVAV